MRLPGSQLLIIYCLTLCLCFICPQLAEADRTITAVELDGNAGGTLTVDPSAVVTAELFVSTYEWFDRNVRWRSSSWRIDDGVLKCVNHSNHNSAGTYSEQFAITAPANSGTHTVEFIAYSNDSCSSGESNSVTRQLVIAPPSVVAISPTSSNPTTSNTSVSWAVEFSQAMTGVDLDDFALVETDGATGASLTTISGSGTSWIVTANTGGSETGTLGLNLIDNDTVINAWGDPLGGAGTGNGNFQGASYTLRSPAPVLSKVASASASTIGDVVTFSVTASNPFDQAFDNVVVSDVLPDGMTYVTHVASAGTVAISGQNLTWTISSLPAGASNTLTIAVELNKQGPLVNTATSPGSESASATVLVLASAVTHFRMDETVGSWTGTAGEVIDSGGTELHGRRRTSSYPTSTNIVDPDPTIASEHASVIGGFCNAASFDGNAIVEVGESALFDYTTQLSASAWIYPTAYPSGSGLYSILSNDVNYEFHLNSSGQLYWWWNSSTLTSATKIPLNQWTHVAITFDSSSGVRRQRIYINGVQDAKTNNWQGTLKSNPCNFYIGGDISTGATCNNIINERNFRGMIDEVKLYSFELSAEEVKADMMLGRSCSGTFDHIQIEHDGTASICAPERVTFRACMDSSCSALYPGSVTVGLNDDGWVGSNTFTIKGGIASYYLSRSTTGTVTLGTKSVTPTPSNSTRCDNGTSQSCSLDFEAASCDFDAVEPGAAPQTPIYTKLSGRSFDIDILALLGSTSINADYTGTVSVDLVDASESSCPTGNGLNTATDLSFSQTDAGRKTVSFNYSAAARNVKVRALVGGSAPACSSDNFAIRPQSFDVASNNATNLNQSGGTVIAAGAPFNLTATAVSGYDGTPQIDNTLLVGSPAAGVLAGTFSAASALTGVASGTEFSYTEVGHFGLDQYAVYDDSFTAVDQPGDCVSGFSNSLSSDRKYGCSFGSPEIPLVIGTSGFGRFVPARFNVNSNTPLLGSACNGVFTYLDQPFPFVTNPQWTVTALNRSGDTTLNYAGSYWHLNSGIGGRSYSDNSGSPAILAVATAGSGSWSGTADNDGVGILTLADEALVYSKPAAVTAPFNANVDLTLSADDLTDTDGVCYDPEGDSVCNSYTIAAIAGTEQRYGRLLLQNAYGPETLPLTIPVRAEYFNGAAFVMNTDDVCSAVDSANFILSNYQNNLADGETIISGNGSLVNGLNEVAINLSAPGSGNDGSVDLTYNLDTAALPWLQFDWNGDGIVNNPTCKATFGIYQGSPRLIYQRESVW